MRALSAWTMLGRCDVSTAHIWRASRAMSATKELSEKVKQGFFVELKMPSSLIMH